MRAPPETGRGARESGFTLLEMLVAVAVLAVLVTLVPRSFVASRAMIERSDDWLAARLVAESVLADELASSPALRPGVRRGEVDGRQWTAVLTSNGVLSDPANENGDALLDVRLSVAISGGQAYEIETMRIGKAR